MKINLHITLYGKTSGKSGRNLASQQNAIKHIKQVLQPTDQGTRKKRPSLIELTHIFQRIIWKFQRQFRPSCFARKFHTIKSCVIELIVRNRLQVSMNSGTQFVHNSFAECRRVFLIEFVALLPFSSSFLYAKRVNN